MLKFFRRIRYNLMEQNKTSKYFKYALGEIILVVIGILIALAISNWNTERINTNRNYDLLVKLSRELDLNIERCALLDSINEGGFKYRFIYTDSIMKILDNGVERENLDFLVSNQIFYINTFNLNTSVFEELKNTGSLYALGSDSLVTSIQLYYQLCDRESFYNLTYSNEVIHLKEICYESGWANFNHLYKINPTEAINDNPWIFNPKSKAYLDFINFVEYASNHSLLISGKLKGIIKASQDLQQLIAKELPNDKS
ncbi:hypothetical protein RM697_07705 [Ichthyenterobacterium sp. W332]|uniref:Uncharacterized protein n=1 Tax=Microcosmobacter mediterraneus TaxID=3075607 RepID=A0ABU2YL20_9FLAO|nr:hypothetical protein [Ichthyenterobacterium sp. W332]MDT0558525.1 hypothetical protein [Ichthyenterobacterium sp. W332]